MPKLRNMNFACISHFTLKSLSHSPVIELQHVVMNMHKHTNFALLAIDSFQPIVLSLATGKTFRLFSKCFIHV